MFFIQKRLPGYPGSLFCIILFPITLLQVQVAELLQSQLLQG